MKDIAMLNKAPLDFFGCNFCLVEKHRMAFVLISKCGLTFLENIAIYASIGMIPDTEDQTHFYIARVKPERFLVPVSEMSGYEREHKSYLKVAVWRDPVERLVSAYKYFILERTLTVICICVIFIRIILLNAFFRLLSLNWGRQIRCGRMSIYAGNLIFILLQRWIVLSRSVN